MFAVAILADDEWVTEGGRSRYINCWQAVGLCRVCLQVEASSTGKAKTNGIIHSGIASR